MRLALAWLEAGSTASARAASFAPSTLMAELRYRILTEPETNLVRQQVELMKTEGVNLEFEDDAIREIAAVSAEMNATVENIGARRLHTVIERIMDEFSFSAPDMESGEVINVDKALVREKVGGLLEETDLSKFIL